jgi:hypothetical protein
VKRQISGLRAADRSAADQTPDGLFLVRVQRIQFRMYLPRPHYVVALLVIEPRRFKNSVLSSRIYCNSKVLWKLNWFLRDFGYDAELLDRDEVDERRLVGLQGVVKVSHVVYDGIPMVRFDGFAPASRWEELSPANLDAQAS